MLTGGLLWGSADAASCCGIGSSRGAASSGIANRTAKITISGVTTGSNGKIEGTRKVSDPLNTVSRDHTTALSVGYGFAKNFSAELGANLKWSEKVISIGNPSSHVYRNNFGLGDGSAALRYTAFRYSVVRPGELTFGLQGTIPWGSVENTQDGARLPREMQAGSGAWAVSLSGYFDWNWPQSKVGFALSGDGTMRFLTPDEVDLGDTYSSSLTFVAGPFWNVRALLGSTYEYALQDVKKDGRVSLGTGGSKLNAVVGAEYEIASTGSVSGSFEFPLYRYANGLQTATGYVVNLSTIFTIKLPGTSEAESINLKELRSENDQEE